MSNIDAMAQMNTDLLLSVQRLTKGRNSWRNLCVKEREANALLEEENKMLRCKLKEIADDED